MIEVNSKGVITLKYYAKFDELNVEEPSKKFKQEFEKFSEFDGWFEITIIKKRKTRTNPMNAYLWAEINNKVAYGFRMLGNELDPAQTDQAVIDILKLTTPELAHEYLKDKFGKDETVDEETGEIFSLTPSTAKMNIQRMQEYWEAIAPFAAQHLHITINPPTKYDNRI